MENKELSIYLAEKVMGWTLGPGGWYKPDSENPLSAPPVSMAWKHTGYCSKEDYLPGDQVTIWHPLTDLSQAMMLLEAKDADRKDRFPGWHLAKVQGMDKFYCHVYITPGFISPSFYGDGDTVAEAICLAVLKATREGRGEKDAELQEALEILERASESVVLSGPPERTDTVMWAERGKEVKEEGNAEARDK